MESNKQLEQFAYVLSYDFKAPIRSIKGFIGLIKERSFENLSEEAKNHFSFVESGAKQLSTLVDDILEYSKQGSPNLNIIKTSINELQVKLFLI